MAQSIKNESAERELRQLADELAERSMSGLRLGEAEAQTIRERFAILTRLASECGLHDVAALGESLQQKLGGCDATTLLHCLRDAVTQVQEMMESPSGEQQEQGDLLADPSLIADFIVESREHLAMAEKLSLALEKDPEDMESINALFRAFHSIKGLAAFLDFDRVYRFSHEVETLLDCTRNRELAMSPEIVDIILAAADFLSQCMDAIQTGRLATLPATEPQLVERIQKTIEQCKNPAAASVDECRPAETIQAAAVLESASPQKEAAIDIVSALCNPAPDGLPTEPVPSKASSADNPSPSGGKGQGSERYSIRVETSKLDYLMDMVGELVIAESLVRTEAEGANAKLVRNIAHLTQITGEVQRTTFRMRMIPIGQLLRRTARIVRDLSRKCAKQVEVEFAGEDTEVDKTIAEEMADPLMHIVRNAIDHGIESPAERIAAGKDPVAKIRLSAAHDGSQIVVEVSDDGRGLDRAKILKKALEKNFVTDANLSDKDIVDLIFKPGFSTATAVTTVSGRGVGMDVVRRQVEKLRGRVDVESKVGCGARFTIRLPLTRAIIDGLVVKVGGSRYVIPMGSVREIFRPEESAVSTVQSKGELVWLHDRLLPIVRLHREFLVQTDVANPWEAVLIVAESEGRTFCLMVDELVGKQELVVKSLGHLLKGTRGVTGGAILGDGRVGLILDVQQIEARA